MELPIYQVDAFTQTMFSGNPAAVCPLQEWLDDSTLQNIASENNLSETAYLIKRRSGHYDLRWFTPGGEVDLCGHATLASAFIIFSELESHIDKIVFNSKSGELLVRRNEDLIILNFPSRKPVPVSEVPQLLIEGLKKSPKEVYKARDYMVVYDDPEVVKAIEPDFGKLKELGTKVIITAKGKDVDFVSRFFAPSLGVNEDPVTGSAHCTLVPYWHEELNQNTFVAKQLSQRGGLLHCTYLDERVELAGNAVLYLRGAINV